MAVKKQPAGFRRRKLSAMVRKAITSDYIDQEQLEIEKAAKQQKIVRPADWAKRSVWKGVAAPGNRVRSHATFWLLQATGLRPIPGVNDIKITVLEVCNITRRELGPSHLGNGCDLSIRVADRSAERTAVSGNRRKNSRCVTLEPQNAAREILGKHSFRRGQQPLATLALGEQLNSIKDFCLGN